MRKGWGIWASSISRRDNGDGTSSMSINIWREGVRRVDPGSAWSCQPVGQKATGRNWYTEVLPETEEEVLHFAGDWALEQTAQKGRILLTENIPEPSGCNPVPCALGWHYLSRELRSDDPLGSLLTWPILWLHRISYSRHFFPGCLGVKLFLTVPVCVWFPSKKLNATPMTFFFCCPSHLMLWRDWVYLMPKISPNLRLALCIPSLCHYLWFKCTILPMCPSLNLWCEVSLSCSCFV